MAGPKKSNVKEVQKKYHCPDCGEPGKMVKFYPVRGKGGMRVNCANGHSHRKGDCKLQ